MTIRAEIIASAQVQSANQHLGQGMRNCVYASGFEIADIDPDDCSARGSCIAATKQGDLPARNRTVHTHEWLTSIGTAYTRPVSRAATTHVCMRRCWYGTLGMDLAIAIAM